MRTIRMEFKVGFKLVKTLMCRQINSNKFNLIYNNLNCKVNELSNHKLNRILYSKGTNTSIYWSKQVGIQLKTRFILILSIY